jgi:hypothetical protein
MKAAAFLSLSTELVKDMKVWVEEAAADGALSPADLETLRSATSIVERTTLREVQDKQEQEPEAGTILI